MHFNSFSGPISSLSVLPTTTFLLASSSASNELHLHSLNGSLTVLQREWRNAYPIDCVASGSFAVAASRDSLSYFNLSRQKETRHHIVGDQTLGVTVANDNLCISVGTGHTMRVFDMRTYDKKPVFSLNLGEDNLNCVAECNGKVVVGSSDGRVYSVDLRKDLLVSQKVTDAAVGSVDVDGDFYAASTSDGYVHIYDDTHVQSVRIDNKGYKVDVLFWEGSVVNGTDSGVVQLRSRDLELSRVLEGKGVMACLAKGEGLLVGSSGGNVYTWTS